MPVSLFFSPEPPYSVTYSKANLVVLAGGFVSFGACEEVAKLRKKTSFQGECGFANYLTKL